MENASKALIIAGAILISILLISVGIIVMNAINNPVQQGAESADSQAVEIFNGKFTGYSGVQNGTTVKALLTAVQSVKGSGHSIEVSGITKASEITDNKKLYDVDFESDDAGYYNKVTISAH